MAKKKKREENISKIDLIGSVLPTTFLQCLCKYIYDEIVG